MAIPLSPMCGTALEAMRLKIGICLWRSWSGCSRHEKLMLAISIKHAKALVVGPWNVKQPAAC